METFTAITIRSKTSSISQIQVSDENFNILRKTTRLKHPLDRKLLSMGQLKMVNALLRLVNSYSVLEFSQIM